MAMSEDTEVGQNTEQELKELEEFKKERERLRRIIGGIGGVQQSKKDSIVNIVFLAIMVLLLIQGLTVGMFDTLLSLEIGMFLVSFKIIYMIHQNAKVNHFEFWVLNSIDFRLNTMERELKKFTRGE